MNEVKSGSYIAQLEKELEKNKHALQIAIKALEFYSKPNHPGRSDAFPGERYEYGCGCCAGIADKNGDNDFDANVKGLTAREALEKINEVCK